MGLRILKWLLDFWRGPQWHSGKGTVLQIAGSIPDGVNGSIPDGVNGIFN